VTDPASLDRFRLPAFEGLDVEDDRDRVDELCAALATELQACRVGQSGLEGVQALIDSLNRLGHAFTRQPRDDGWATWLQHTNGGTRHFYIHVELDDADSVMVLHDETLDATVARRRSGMTPEESARDERVARFYERGLALVTGDVAYGDLDEADRLLLCLYELETGVGNGGFHTYVTNTEGAQLADASAFLERVGATELAAVVADVIQALPPSSDGLTEAVWAALDANAERFSELDERFHRTRESLAELVLDFLDRGA
jgi:hypothetical protein